MSDIDLLAAALVKFQAAMPAVQKNSDNPFFKSKYADLADIVETAKPVLAEHGLAVAQFLSHDGDRNTLVTYLIHESGQFLTGEMLLMLPKDDPQGQGSATTYARRYAYSAALGIVTDSDDDGNAASRRADVPALPKPEPFNLAGFKEACALAGLDPLDVVAHADLHKTLGELSSEDRSAIKASLAALSAAKEEQVPA